MLSKRCEFTEVDRRICNWLHVPSGNHWSTSSDTHKVQRVILLVSFFFFIIARMFCSFCSIFQYWLRFPFFIHIGIMVIFVYRVTNRDNSKQIRQEYRKF